MLKEYCKRATKHSNLSLFEYASNYRLDTHNKRKKDTVLRIFPRPWVTGPEHDKIEEYCQVQLMTHKPCRSIEDLQLL